MSLSWKRIVPGVGLAATLSLLAVPGVAAAAPESPGDTAGTETLDPGSEETPGGTAPGSGETPGGETPGGGDPGTTDPEPPVDPEEPVDPEQPTDPEEPGDPSQPTEPDPTVPTDPEPNPTVPEEPGEGEPGEGEPGEGEPGEGEPTEDPTTPVDPDLDPEEPGDETDNPGSETNPGGGSGTGVPAPRPQLPVTPDEKREVANTISNLSFLAERNTKAPRGMSNVGRSVAYALYRSASQQELALTPLSPGPSNTDGTDELAYTGASMEYQAALAAGLLAFGAGAIAASRRREA